MKNQELFNKTISILVNAYQNNTLEHHNCYACAVGNIIAANCGYNLIKTDCEGDDDYYTGYNGKLIYEPKLKFEHLVVVYLDGLSGNINNKIAITHISKSGYSFKELQKIESAFEISQDRNWNADDYMFYGLISVCDCLMEIHEASIEETKQAKELFIKA